MPPNQSAYLEETVAFTTLNCIVICLCCGKIKSAEETLT